VPAMSGYPQVRRRGKAGESAVFLVPGWIAGDSGPRRIAAIGIGPAAEYSIVTIFAIWAFISVFIVHAAGTVHPVIGWLTFHGTGAGAFGATMIIAVASLSGWDGGIYLNEETEAPEKNPGRGAVLGVALTGLLFVIMYGTYQGVGSSAQLQAHSANAIAWVGQRLAGTAGDRIMSFAVVISVLATTQVATSAPRESRIRCPETGCCRGAWAA